MGIQIKKHLEPTNNNMKAFVAVSALLAAAAADQTHHQVIKHGNAPAVSHSVHKPHGSYAAVVASQPHAAPQDVHNPYAGEKYSTAVHAPAHKPVHAPAYHHPAPAYHAAPVYHKPAPVYHKPAPVYHPAPIVHKPAPYPPAPVVAHPVKVAHPAPYHPAPVVHKPAPVYHPAPVVHKPAPYHPAPAYKEPSYDEPAVYEYGYAVADDYSGANFASNEKRDGYATSGEYRVALPDGRTQIVTYSTADAYSGNVAYVKYEGEAHYEPYHPAPVKAHPTPVYHA